MNRCGTASSELQHPVDNLHDLSGVTHGPAQTDAITESTVEVLIRTLQPCTGATLAPVGELIWGSGEPNLL